MDIYKVINGIQDINKVAMKEAEDRQKSLCKPTGSLGSLEDISVKIAGITGKLNNDVNKRILFLFGSDNGIYEEGISAAPQEFTRILMYNYAKNTGCGINVICDHYKTELYLVDVGIKGEINHPNIDSKKLMKDGSNNFSKEKAIPEDILLSALNLGVSYAKYALDNNYKIIGNGEVGMGNTTTATACVMALSGLNDPKLVVSRGAGLTDKAFEVKKYVISEALKKYNLDKDKPLEILSSVGGLDIATITGLYLGAAYYQIPIVIDGLISATAALAAYRLNPLSVNYMFSSHMSTEKGYLIAVNELGIEPILNLKMRLGEGTGCPIAFEIIESALSVINNMSTFDDLNLETEYLKDLKMI